jgi:hypothetical protein
MSNEFLRNKELSLKAKGLLAVCLSLPDTWDYSINGLVAICKESITAVRNAMKELEDLGYMKINKLQNEKGHFYYEYVIFETPHIGFLYVDDVGMDKLPMENPVVGKQRQLNTNQLSTEEVITDELNLCIEERVNPQLFEAFNGYLEMRKEIGAPITLRGLKMLITRMESLSNDDLRVQKLMLENATLNQWKNIYRPKEQEIEAVSQALAESRRSFYGI